MVLKVGHFGKRFINTWKVLKCGAGEERRRSVGPIMWKMKKCYRVKGERNILQTIKRGKANWNGHILHWNCLLKHVIEGKIEGRVGVTGREGRRRKQLLNYLKNIENTGNWKRKRYIASMENSLWKRLFTFDNSDGRMNERITYSM